MRRAASLSHHRRLAFARRFVLHDVACQRACRNRQRTRQIHLPRPAASWKVAILRADHDLVRTRRNARSGVDACAAAWLDNVRACLLEDLEIALAHAVLARFLRAELQIEPA